MSRAYWRSPGTYAELQSLDAPGIAYEYLKRDPEFLEDQERLRKATRTDSLDPAEADAFARRWGLRFRRDD
jgi:hypothetical protein